MRCKKRLDDALKERTNAIFEVMYKSLYRVDVDLPEEYETEKLSLTYYGDDYFRVGYKVKVYVRCDLCCGTITAKGADADLYDGFPAGLREIQSRVED